MKIESLSHKDLSYLVDLQPTGWLDIRPFFDKYIKADFCYPIKIVENNDIVSVGTSVVHNDIAWLAHIIVHPDKRRKGLGKLMTETLVNESQSKKCDTIYLIATDMGTPVYQKIGFEIETEYLFYKDLVIDLDLNIADNIEIFHDDDLAQIAELDYEISGENRLFHLKQHLKGAFTYKVDGIVKGFYLADFGEGLIIADCDIAGVELMKLRLRDRNDAIFPSDNLAANKFMRGNNMKLHSKAKRMRLGRKREIKLSSIYNRIGGNIG